MIRASFASLVIAVALLLPPSLFGQEARNEQIAQAGRLYADFDSPGALRILRVALDPAAGPADSAWGSGVQLLAQILIEDSKAPLAATWLQWAFRTNPALRIDSVTYLPSVVTAAKVAQQATRGGSAGDVMTTTRFTWPAAAAPADTAGFIRTPTSANPVVRVLVEGVGILTPNQNLRMAPGTYAIQATADGYVTARISREVLPGTTTNLSFALRPTAVAAGDTVLPADARGRFERQVVRLSVRRFGMDPSCVAGAYVSGNGLVVTTYQAIRGADAVEAEPLDGTAPIRAGITVAAYDVRRNIAILKLPVTRTDSLVPNAGFLDGQFAWGYGFAPCATGAASRTRVAAWTDRPNGTLQLADSLPNAGQGGPVIDRAGTLLGIGAAARVAVPALHVAEVLAQARRNVGTGLIAFPEVSRRENHVFGSLVVRTTVTGATFRVTPRETWQWPELARTGPSPLTFPGPVGRYRVELLVGGQPRQEADATIVAATQTPVTLNAPTAPAPLATAPAAEVPRRKGKSPLPFIIIGGVGAGAAVFLIAGKKSPPPGGGGGDTQTGAINISIPVNP